MNIGMRTKKLIKIDPKTAELYWGQCALEYRQEILTELYYRLPEEPQLNFKYKKELRGDQLKSTVAQLDGIILCLKAKLEEKEKEENAEEPLVISPYEDKHNMTIPEKYAYLFKARFITEQTEKKER